MLKGPSNLTWLILVEIIIEKHRSQLFKRAWFIINEALLEIRLKTRPKRVLNVSEAAISCLDRDVPVNICCHMGESDVSIPRALQPASHPSPTMASTVQKIQDKLFGRLSAKSTEDLAEVDQHPFPAGSNAEPVDQPASLTIDIPKDPNTPTPMPQRKNTDSPNSDHDIGPGSKTPPLKTYRERLAEKLGDAYKGAEKYRLLQDNDRERHWKRWGPYLSDRQWVCVQQFLPFHFLIALS